MSRATMKAWKKFTATVAPYSTLAVGALLKAREKFLS